MKFNEFMELSGRTENNDSNAIIERVSKPNMVAAMHHVIGLSTEAGELLDAFKKHIFYGKPLDIVNVKEEIGDVMWYVARLCKALDIDFEECLQLNINKLAKRYPDKYNDVNAVNRDLQQEKAALSQAISASMFCVQNFELTYKMLVEKSACRDGLDYFKSTFGEKANIQDVLKKLEEDKKNYATFLFKNFELTGLCKFWYENGQLRYSWNFKNGRLHGLREAWYENGQLECRHNYKNDEQDGLSEGWHANGRLWYRYNFKNGRGDGLPESWYENGQLEYSDLWDNGKLVKKS